MSINELQDEIIEEFEAFEDWLERYQLILDYANELKENPFPEADRNAQNLIDGCQSQVWFTVRMEEGKMIINVGKRYCYVTDSCSQWPYAAGNTLHRTLFHRPHRPARTPQPDAFQRCSSHAEATQTIRLSL